jgi:hypothetical protein
MPSDSTARALTKRLDALASALREAGVAPERSAQLLSAAASATMHAVTLEALREHDREPVAKAAALHDPLRLAA